MTDTDTLRALLDRQAITEQIYRYCRAVDRIDEELGHSVFHPDATADYGVDVFRGGGRAAIDFICTAHRSGVAHSHQVTNILIALDGDKAGSEAYYVSAVRFDAGERRIQATTWGRYLDGWSRRHGVWRIAHRQVMRDVNDRTDLGPAGGGTRAQPDRSDPSYALLTPPVQTS